MKKKGIVFLISCFVFFLGNNIWGLELNLQDKASVDKILNCKNYIRFIKQNMK